MELMQELDGPGIEIRRRRKLRRRVYFSKGPNFAWHVDGYDKIKPYGFCIHDCIDGFSRRIMWLEVGPSNNDPKCVAKYFMDCVAQQGGCPTIMQTDRGTENGTIAALQCLFRDEHPDRYAGINSHRYCRSTANQRIEAWWSHFRRQRMEWWIVFFADLTLQGIFNKDDLLHVYAIRYTFMPLLREELNYVADLWNNHYINRTPNARCPPGRPNILYFTGDEEHLQPVTEDKLEFGYRQATIQSLSGSEQFDQYASDFANLNNWAVATTWQEALKQFDILINVALNGQ